MSQNQKSDEAILEERRAKNREYYRRYAAKNRDEILKKKREYRAAHPERHRSSTRKYYEQHKAERQAAIVERGKALQNQTLETATKRREPWSAEEDRELLTSDLTVHELALQLGRTYASVSVRRARLRREEKQALEEAPNESEPASPED